jgi:hypothetical protein
MPQTPHKLPLPPTNLRALNWELETCPYQCGLLKSPIDSTKTGRTNPGYKENPKIRPHKFTTFLHSYKLWCYVQDPHLSVASISFPPMPWRGVSSTKKPNRNSEHLGMWDRDTRVHASYKAGSHICTRPRVMSHVFCQTKQNQIIVSPKLNHSVPQSSSSSSSVALLV